MAELFAACAGGAVLTAWAIHLGQRSMAEALLDAGAKANTVDEYGETPLTLANGFIPSGCVLGQVTATQLYGPYDDTASDGRQTATHVLWNDVRAVRENGTTASKVGGAGMVRGDVSVSKLPFQSGAGAIDANGKADLPLIRWEA